MNSPSETPASHQVSGARDGRLRGLVAQLAPEILDVLADHPPGLGLVGGGPPAPPTEERIAEPDHAPFFGGHNPLVLKIISMTHLGSSLLRYVASLLNIRDIDRSDPRN